MTLREKIGQMLVFGWEGSEDGGAAEVNSHARALVDDLYVGGIVLMGRNISPPPQMLATTEALQARARTRGLPLLFVATDQEGGRVQRLGPPDYPARPAARELGATNDSAVVRAAYADMGREMASVGINWCFAPVLDVDSNPKNPVIGARSFGADAALVARMGTAAVQGLQHDAGILACAKHFPGHGDTDTDSHFALPTITRLRTDLDNIELPPFRVAIDTQVAAIMTAHILFPALDTALPATLSPAVLTGLLREEIGYNGLVITDDLEMRGVADRWGAPQAAVLAIEAGADMLLCCHTHATQEAIVHALMQAVHSGRISEARLDQSVQRIARAKTQWLGGC